MKMHLAAALMIKVFLAAYAYRFELEEGQMLLLDH